ncbi:MAG: hypothetical protein ACHWZW_17885 [Spirulina sp.]
MTLLPETQAYFIRLAIHPQQILLGHYQAGQFYPSEYGTIVADAWVHSATHRKGVEIDQWIITPDELCGIVHIQSPAFSAIQTGISTAQTTPKPWLLSSFIASFKATAAKRINLRRNRPGQPVWQPSYQEQWLQDATTLAQVRHRLSTYAKQEEGA